MNEEQNTRKINIVTLALGIAILPPIWAVAAPYFGISTGAVALICAGLYVANGNKREDAVRISIGFLLGDAWAVFAIWFMEIMKWNPDIELYLTLFTLGGLAVIIGETFEKYVFTPAWLCGWAIGLTIMGALDVEELGTLPVQVGAAMLAGTIYAGVGVDAFQKALMRRLKRK